MKRAQPSYKDTSSLRGRDKVMGRCVSNSNAFFKSFLDSRFRGNDIEGTNGKHTINPAAHPGRSEYC